MRRRKCCEWSEWLLRELEVPIEPALREGVGEQRAAFGRRKRDRFGG